VSDDIKSEIFEFEIRFGFLVRALVIPLEKDENGHLKFHWKYYRDLFRAGTDYEDILEFVKNMNVKFNWNPRSLLDLENDPKMRKVGWSEMKVSFERKEDAALFILHFPSK
jgi:hypothetical protein